MVFLLLLNGSCQWTWKLFFSIALKQKPFPCLALASYPPTFLCSPKYIQLPHYSLQSLNVTALFYAFHHFSIKLLRFPLHCLKHLPKAPVSDPSLSLLLKSHSRLISFAWHFTIVLLNFIPERITNWNKDRNKMRVQTASVSHRLPRLSAPHPPPYILFPTAALHLKNCSTDCSPGPKIKFAGKRLPWSNGWAVICKAAVISVLLSSAKTA